VASLHRRGGQSAGARGNRTSVGAGRDQRTPRQPRSCAPRWRHADVPAPSLSSRTLVVTTRPSAWGSCRSGWRRQPALRWLPSVGQ